MKKLKIFGIVYAACGVAFTAWYQASGRSEGDPWSTGSGAYVFGVFIWPFALLKILTKSETEPTKEDETPTGTDLASSFAGTGTSTQIVIAPPPTAQPVTETPLTFTNDQKGLVDLTGEVGARLATAKTKKERDALVQDQLRISQSIIAGMVSFGDPAQTETV